MSNDLNHSPISSPSLPSLPRIFKRYKRYIDAAKIISFDIFDTLLLRPYQHPSDVFLHLSVLYNTPAFYESRISAESNARVALNKEVDNIYLSKATSHNAP